MLLSEEFLSRWEDLVEGVDKTDVPIDCIKRVVIKLKDGRRRYLNMSTLRKKGLDPIELEGVLNQKLEEYDKQIQNVDFFVDVDQVADLIQPETDKMLGGL
mgnify:FL=1|jgi:hypothetical protein